MSIGVLWCHLTCQFGKLWHKSHRRHPIVW